jgi:hypothetical protein
MKLAVEVSYPDKYIDCISGIDYDIMEADWDSSHLRNHYYVFFNTILINRLELENKYNLSINLDGKFKEEEIIYFSKSMNLNLILEDYKDGKIFNFYIKKKQKLWLNNVKEIIAKFYYKVDDEFNYKVRQSEIKKK